MKANYKTIFEFLRLGLVTCLMEKQEVIQWADEEILSSKKSNNDVIELSLSGQLPYSQLIGLLNTFQGIPNRQSLTQLLLSYARNKYLLNPDQSQVIISGLQVLKAENYCDKVLGKQLTMLENHLIRYENSELTSEELQIELENFLNQYSAYQEDVYSILHHTEYLF